MALGQVAQQIFWPKTCGDSRPHGHWVVCVAVGGAGRAVSYCVPAPRVHSNSTHSSNTQQHPSSPQAAHKQHMRMPGTHNICPHAAVWWCVCVCVCVSGGETQPSVGVDLDRWHFTVMACPQGPSSCFPGHGCLHRGPRSPNMAVAGLLVAVSGLHKHTVSWTI